MGVFLWNEPSAAPITDWSTLLVTLRLQKVLGLVIQENLKWKKPQNRKDNESEEEILLISCTEEEINTVDNHPNKILATMNIGGKEVKMLIDSGRLAMFWPSSIFPKGTVVEKSSHTLKMYSKSTMSVIGKAKISLVNPKNMESYLIDLTIVDGNFAPLLRLETAQQMKLVVVQTWNIFVR